MKMDNVWVVFLDGSVTVKQIIMPYSIFPVTKLSLWECVFSYMIIDEIIGDLMKMKLM